MNKILIFKLGKNNAYIDPFDHFSHLELNICLFTYFQTAISDRKLS